MLELLINLLLTGLLLQAPFGAVKSAVQQLPLAPQKNQAPSGPLRDWSSLSSGVDISAPCFMVLEPKSGQVLYEKNSGEIRSIASLTKLMTAVVFLNHNLGWDQTVEIIKDDIKPGAVPDLREGETFSVKDVFSATLIASSNEGAAALARISGLSSADFVAEMNQQAVNLFMDQTEFVDPTGLDSGNKSTAKDILKLVQAALSREEIKSAVSRKDYTITILNKNLARKIISTDLALGEKFSDGANSYYIEAGKTGYLEQAGYCFVSQVKDSNNRQVLIAVLGSSSTLDRFSDTKSLAYWVFNNYSW